eukprot:jgi/Mesvir1/23428/Mv22288-RA.1
MGPDHDELRVVATTTLLGNSELLPVSGSAAAAALAGTVAQKLATELINSDLAGHLAAAIEDNVADKVAAQVVGTPTEAVAGTLAAQVAGNLADNVEAQVAKVAPSYATMASTDHDAINATARAPSSGEPRCTLVPGWWYNGFKMLLTYLVFLNVM